MHSRLATLCASVMAAGMLAFAAWHYLGPANRAEQPQTQLPVPPFPPRIAEGGDYETCLSTLSVDPGGAIGIAEAWQKSGGGDGATHCRGLALIAAGQPEAGAKVLETLAAHTTAPPLARASLLSQAAQARLMVGQADKAATDASDAINLSPEDADLLIMRATAEGQTQSYAAAVSDLDAALRLDSSRTDALVARATMHRKLNQLDLALSDATAALARDPGDPDALLERGILRQRNGDRAGARADWEHAQLIDPDSTTGNLAAQNLALLEAGQARE